MVEWPDLNIPPINLWTVWGIDKNDIKSPCINICKVDNAGYCIGCKRHIKEIANWQTLSNEEKYKIIMRIYEAT